MKDKNYYNQYSKEELEEMLKHPEEIETGCEQNCDACLSEEIKLIEKALKESNLSV